MTTALRPNAVKAALKRGDSVVGTMLTEVNSPSFIMMCANAGFDFVFIDMEHGMQTLEQVSHMINTARLAGIVPLVRVRDLSYTEIAGVLDAGAMGIMLPRVETRDQVEKLVSYMKYPPMGARGASTNRGHTEYMGMSPQTLVKHFNEHTLVILQIERKKAVENIDELLSVPGVDVALIGPFDLTISLGLDNMKDDLVQEYIQRTVDSAKKHGVASGIHPPDTETALNWGKKGMTMLMAATDITFFSSGAATCAKELRTGLSQTYKNDEHQGGV
jgi:2-keto-3-deoxy-L-rhamnonate aldolase RhmA